MDHGGAIKTVKLLSSFAHNLKCGLLLNVHSRVRKPKGKRFLESSDRQLAARRPRPVRQSFPSRTHEFRKCEPLMLLSSRRACPESDHQFLCQPSGKKSCSTERDYCPAPPSLLMDPPSNAAQLQAGRPLEPTAAHCKVTLELDVRGVTWVYFGSLLCWVPEHSWDPEEFFVSIGIQSLAAELWVLCWALTSSLAGRLRAFSSSVSSYQYGFMCLLGVSSHWYGLLGLFYLKAGPLDKCRWGPLLYRA